MNTLSILERSVCFSFNFLFFPMNDLSTFFVLSKYMYIDTQKVDDGGFFRASCMLAGVTMRIS